MGSGFLAVTHLLHQHKATVVLGHTGPDPLPCSRPASAFCLTRVKTVCVAALYTLPTQTKIASWALCVHGARVVGRDPEKKETVVKLTRSSNGFFVCLFLR